MAILFDVSQLFIAAISAQANNYMEENLIKHICLNTLRNNVRKFKGEYGEVVLCCDSRNYWRKEIFPHYKAHRKKNRDNSKMDWKIIFKVINELKQELKENFPYKVLEVDGAEADDIIGVLAKQLSQKEKVLIVSRDGDYKQLQKYPNVKQYNQTLGVFEVSKNPELDLKEKIIRGDSGDGIPNVLSNDNCFVIGKRQKPVMTEKLEKWLHQNPKDVFSEEVYRNYCRNQQLISFDYIPNDIQNKILESYETAMIAPRKNIYDYLVKNKMIELLDAKGDF